MKDFYNKCRALWTLPLWPYYLRWVYKHAFLDALNFNVLANNKALNFTCLLCGVAGEITANEFISFVLKYKPHSKIIIIDIGKEQIKSVQKLVKDKYPHSDIVIKQENALNLRFIKNKSINWIDTDGFFSFFDENQLLQLLKEWKRILRNDGFITFRELTSHGFTSKFFNTIRCKIIKSYLKIIPHPHTSIELENNFQKLHYKFSRKNTPIPLFERYCLVNN